MEQENITTKEQAERTQQIVSEERKQEISEVLSGFEREGLEKQTSIEALTKGIDSPRFDELKKSVDMVLEGLLAKYDFLDTTTRNIVKLGIINEFLKNPIIPGILDGIVIDLVKFFNDLVSVDPKKVEELEQSKSNDPKVGGKIEKIQKYFLEITEKYENKFKEINSRFSKEAPNLTIQQKQAIISNVDVFRDPSKINDILNLDVSKIDFTKITKREFSPEEKQKLAEYLVSSRDKFEKIAKKLEIGDKSREMIFDMMRSGSKTGEIIKSITKFLLEIPLLKDFLAVFLGIDAEKPLESFEKTLNDYKIFNGLKSLGKGKDKDGNQVEGVGVFKNIDLSGLQFSAVKNELKELFKIFPELGKENASDFWEKAFSDGYEKDGFIIKFEIGDKKEDGKIDNKELKTILRDGIDEYYASRKSKKLQEKVDSHKQQEQVRKERLSSNIQSLVSSINEIEKQISEKEKEVGDIEGLLGKFSSRYYENMPNWYDIFDWFKDNDISAIKLSDIVGTDNFENMLKRQVGEGEYKKLNANKDYKNSLNLLFSFIKDFLNSEKGRGVDRQLSLKDFLGRNSDHFKAFKDFLENIKSKISEEISKLRSDLGQRHKEKSRLEQERGEVEGNIEKYGFMETVLKRIDEAPDGISLLHGIDIQDGKRICFNGDNQELIIGDLKYKIDLKHSSRNVEITLNDIEITGGKVKFSIEAGILGQKRDYTKIFSKTEIKNWIRELFGKDKFSYNGDNFVVSFTKQN